MTTTFSINKSAMQIAKHVNAVKVEPNEMYRSHFHHQETKIHGIQNRQNIGNVQYLDIYKKPNRCECAKTTS